MDAIAEANELLRAKGYGERELGVFPAVIGEGKALLKGAKIVSPFSDGVETVLRAVRECVPPAAELGRKTLTPRGLRECLGA